MPSSRRPLRFNDPEGDLGLIAIDNTRGPSIRFCEGRELAGYRVGGNSRMITRIATALPAAFRVLWILRIACWTISAKTRRMFF